MGVAGEQADENSGRVIRLACPASIQAGDDERQQRSRVSKLRFCGSAADFTGAVADAALKSCYSWPHSPGGRTAAEQARANRHRQPTSAWSVGVSVVDARRSEARRGLWACARVGRRRRWPAGREAGCAAPFFAGREGKARSKESTVQPRKTGFADADPEWYNKEKGRQALGWQQSVKRPALTRSTSAGGRKGCGQGERCNIEEERPALLVSLLHLSIDGRRERHRHGRTVLHRTQCRSCRSSRPSRRLVFGRLRN
jgi:hypothetical protein